MRERGGLTIMAVVLVVMAARDTIATPAITHPHHHQETSEGPTSTPSMPANHVEDEYLDDALDDWLHNFDTYTFMVKQDLDTHDEEGGEGEDVTAAREDQEEEEEEEGPEEAWSAPIAVSVGSKSLLNPHLDYLVTVESLVAEEGSIFLTLSKYNNQTECGVGGLTVEAVMRSTPHRSTAGGGGLVRQAEGQSGGQPQNSSLSALIAFGLQNEGNITLPDTSAWAEVSEDYWWARGRLAGGGMLSITFTPPECGCLSLSTYYALPVGNLTLVVGPQAYPNELQILLCMDPLPEAPVLDEYEDEEEEEEEEQKDEEEDVGEYLQEPSALVAPKTTGETDTETEAEENPSEPPVTPRKRKTRVGGKKRKTKKTRRQMKRQRIRQAGRRQARRQQRQQLREEDEDEEGEDAGRAGFRRSRRRWKQKRKGKKAWKKIKKNSRRGRRRFHGARQHHGHHELNGTSAENMTDHHHHHHPQHHLEQNVSEAIQQEERLIDILLRDEPENSTLEEQEEEEAMEGSSVTEEGVGEEGVGEEETPRQRRKNRRQRKKMMRKERRKAHHPPGFKFCCKQGVKHKKNILEFNTTSENSPGPCNATSELVSNFANHQFDIEVEACDLTYTKCCSRFTADMWNAIKARKMARRRDRKERRKSRRQDRKHRRQNERRKRKEMMRQSRRQHQVAEGPEEDAERQGEGDAAAVE